MPFGRSDGVFVSPKSLIDNLHGTGDPRIIESTLGFPEGTFSGKGSMTRTYVDNPAEYGLRAAQGTESGANSLWVPGGYTLNPKGGAGLPEMVVNSLRSPSIDPGVRILTGEPRGVSATFETMQMREAANNAGMQTWSGACFLPGTPVHTRQGVKPIEQIEAGDWVAARNEFTKETGWKPVRQVFRLEDLPVVHVKVKHPSGKQETISATSEHPFFVHGDWWRNAAQLQAGDQLELLGGGLSVVVETIAAEGSHVVHNFEVADDHTYFVGEEGVWVHNACSVREILEALASGGRASNAGPVSFANRVSGEKFSIEPVPFLSTEQALRTPGKILYVVKEDGSLVIARTNSDNLFGHFDLAKGENILAGGEGRIYSGQVKSLDNASGHYLPEGQSARDAAVNAFRNAGFKVPETAYVEKVYDFKLGKWVPK